MWAQPAVTHVNSTVNTPVDIPTLLPPSAAQPDVRKAQNEQITKNVIEFSPKETFKVEIKTPRRSCDGDTPRTHIPYFGVVAVHRAHTHIFYFQSVLSASISFLNTDFVVFISFSRFISKTKIKNSMCRIVSPWVLSIRMVSFLYTSLNEYANKIVI